MNSNIEKRLDRIEKTLLRNTMSLEEHMRRTDILEKEVSSLKKSELARSAVTSFIDNGFKIFVALIAAVVGLKNLNIFKF